MRSITKIGNGCYQLRQANGTWKNFKYKNKVTSDLLNEQYGLCAYSEIRPDQMNLGTHIEHIEPKSMNSARTFDYTNLVLSALSNQDLKTINKAEIFGGHAKLNQYDASLFISCLQADCARYFVYLSNGKIEPARALNQTEKKQAQYTIDLLNLNSNYLVVQRKNWLDELDGLIDQHINNDWSLPDLAAVDLVPCNNKLSPFFTATRQRFGNIAENVLADNAPELQ